MLSCKTHLQAFSMSSCSSRRSFRRSRRHSQLNHDCGSCQEVKPTLRDPGIECKKLRSGRTIETPPSSQEQAEDRTKKNIHAVLQGLTFIQCESESCLKWRKISQEEADLYEDKQWFCHLNKNDPDHCRCDQPEEDQQVQLAESSGYRYTFSTLPCGSLVWAKMTGHVAWPSIISQDPDSKECFWKDGVTEFYHVEFLGKRHYHSWVSPLFLDPYGDGRKPEFPSMSDKKGQSSKKKQNGKKKALTFSRADKVVKSKSYQKSFELAVEEAESLRVLTNEERHLKCVYIPKELKTKKCDKKVEKVQVKYVEKIKEASGPQRKPRNQRALPEVTPKNPGSTSNMRAHKQRKQTASGKQQKSHPKPINKSKCKKRLFNSNKDNKHISQELLKEEKLFNGAWVHFMKSRELVFDRKLSFNGSSLSAFRLFMSVQERGGYKEISSSPSDWAAIVRELTGKSSADKCKSTLLKKLFRRNLLPYEKHLLCDSKDIVNNSTPAPLKTEPVQTNSKAEICVPTSGQYVHAPSEIKTTMTATPFVTGGYTCGASNYPSGYSSSGTCCQPVNSIILPSSTSTSTLTPSSLNYYGVSSGMMPPVTAPPNVYMRTLPMARNGDTNMFRKLESQKDGKLSGKPLVAPQTFKGIPPSTRNGWCLDPVDFQKNILEIDNIIQDLDKTHCCDTSLQGDSETQRDSGRPVLEFYSMQYDDLDTVLKEQRKKSNLIDDVQCVPEGLPPPSYIIPEKIPPPYLSFVNQRPVSQVDDLVQEVSRLDAVLQMEFSEL